MRFSYSTPALTGVRQAQVFVYSLALALSIDMSAFTPILMGPYTCQHEGNLIRIDNVQSAERIRQESKIPCGKLSKKLYNL